MKKVEVRVYEDREFDGIYWVAFTPAALSAFRLWLKSVALAKALKVKFVKQKKVVSFRRATRSDLLPNLEKGV